MRFVFLAVFFSFLCPCQRIRLCLKYRVKMTHFTGQFSYLGERINCFGYHHKSGACVKKASSIIKYPVILIFSAHKRSYSLNCILISCVLAPGTSHYRWKKAIDLTCLFCQTFSNWALGRLMVFFLWSLSLVMHISVYKHRLQHNLLGNHWVFRSLLVVVGQHGPSKNVNDHLLYA